MELTEETTEGTFAERASHAQRRLWFLEQMEGGGPAWNIQAVLRLRGPLDAELLREALNAVVRRHEALRTTFRAEAGDPVQVVWPWPGIELETLEPGGGEEAAAEAADRWLSKAWQRPFDIESGPLVRAALLRIGEREHRLALGLHHLIADGLSLQLLYREILDNYRRLTDGEPPLEDEPGFQYPDFAAWESENVTPELLAPSLEVWRRRLKDADDAAGFPADRRRTPGTPARGASLSDALPLDLVEDLRRLAAARGATLFMVLLAAFDTLLHRYSGRTDVMVGVPVAGRTQPGLEQLIGCFVNTLVLRTDLDGDPTFEQLLDRVKEVSLEGVRHQEVPLEWLVRELRPERDGDRQPFFTTVLHLAEVDLAPIRIGQLTADVVRMDTAAPGVDLALTLVTGESGLSAVWEYDATLFDETTIDHLRTHFRTLLESALAEPGQRLSRLRLLDDAESEALVAPGPPAAVGPPMLHEMFGGWAVRQPDAVAAVSGEVSLTFGELEVWAGRLAGVLRGCGVGPEVAVGVCLPRGVGWLVALLAVFKAGGVYVPLDAGYPAARLEFMVRDAGVAVVVGAGAAAAGVASVTGCPLVEPGGGFGDLPVAEGGDVGAVAAHPDNLAYVIYTSGSTGRPKGVQITHASLAAVMAAQRTALPHAPDDVVLQFCSPCFDGSMFEIGLAVGAGATLAFGTADELVPGEPLAALMDRHRVTSWTAPPSSIAALGGADVPSLRHVHAGGEVLTARTIRHRAARARCFNLYGPTEATIWGTGHAFGSEDGEGPLPIGTAIPGAKALVLDAHMRPVPANVIGELYLGGAGIARAYLGRPALTAERFLPDPFAERPGGRLYRSGDLAFRRSDGELVFAGRADDQVKIRGFRVELGEIESTIAAHRGVRESVVLPRADDLGVTRLAACVVREPDADVTADELREHLAGRLPAHLAPATYLFLPELPATSNGKTDRAAVAALLEEEAGQPRPEDADHQVPRTPLEEAIAGIWQEVLGVPRIGRTDDFFAQGGHSLLAAQVVARIRAATGADIPVRTLFEHRVLSDLAEAVLAHALAEEPKGGRP